MAEVALKDRKRTTSDLKSWLDDVASYERAFNEWEGRVEKILKRYRDDPRSGKKTWTEAKFNILWSNVQTLSAATFARLPKPAVSRSFKDSDPVGRVASLILERGLDYHVNHYPEYKTALKSDVMDRFLGGRGTAWVRYEPHFRAAPNQGVDGDQVTEDVDTPDEELDYECVAVDYVHDKDFGHSVARTWEEVNRVWRKVYMAREALVERFGEEKAKLIPMDADPRIAQPDKKYGSEDAIDRATIFEGWDKGTREAVWFSKSVKDFLDRKPDPLGLEDVFPCPKPLFSTLTSDSLVPVPDFVIYQDQANELDILADRIDGLVKALKVAGGYDASVPELARIFTEAENGTLIPVKNWASFAEKNGLDGSISLIDLDPIARALKEAYIAFEAVKGQVYELTGISDIVRGMSVASETATAQQLKSQYASLRLKGYQDEVSQFATEILRIMAQVMCRKFSPQTLAIVGGAEQLSDVDKPLVPQALALLVGPERLQDPEAEPGPNPLRQFRIEIAADSLIYLDEEQEKTSRIEFLGAVGGYLRNVADAVGTMRPDMAGVLIPLLMDMMKFGVTGYRVGKTIEGSFDQVAEQLKQLAANPPQQGADPTVEAERMKQDGETQRLQQELAAKDQMHQREMAMKDQQSQRELMMKDQQHQRDIQAQSEMHEREQNNKAVEGARKVDLDRELGEKKIEASSKPTTNVQVDAAGDLAKVGEIMTQMMQGMMQANQESQKMLAQGMQALAHAAQTMAQAAVAEKQVTKRDANGRVLSMAPMMGVRQS